MRLQAWLVCYRATLALECLRPQQSSSNLSCAFFSAQASTSATVHAFQQRHAVGTPRYQPARWATRTAIVLPPSAALALRTAAAAPAWQVGACAIRLAAAAADPHAVAGGVLNLPILHADSRHCISLGSCRAFPDPDSLFMHSTCCSDAQWVNECLSTEGMAVACQSGRCKPVIGRPMAAGGARRKQTDHQWPVQSKRVPLIILNIAPQLLQERMQEGSWETKQQQIEPPPLGSPTRARLPASTLSHLLPLAGPTPAWPSATALAPRCAGGKLLRFAVCGTAADAGSAVAEMTTGSPF